MGKRGAKPKFTDAPCPNKDCKFYGISGKGNIIRQWYLSNQEQEGS